MILEGLAVAAFIKTCCDTDEALTMEEGALKKYARAFERSEEAELLVQKKAEYTDKRLANVAKKKKAIIQNTVPRFVEVYGKIQRIELENKTSVNELVIKNNVKKMEILSEISILSKKDFTDKELICGLITKGFGGMIKADAERYLSAASSQMRASNVAYSQAKSIGEAYDAIVGRADRIADLLMKMNALFIGSIAETEKTIAKNGLDIGNYSEYEKGVLMTCVNIAAAMSDIISIPVVNEQGQLYESAKEMVEKGEQYLKKMNQLIQA